MVQHSTHTNARERARTRRTLFWLKAWGAAISLLSLVVAGCPDNTAGSSGSTGVSTGTGTTATTPSTFIPPDGSSGLTGGDTPNGNGTASFITLTQAVLSNVNPNQYVDLIGTNSDIGNNCPDTTSCQCQFSWTDSSGVLRQTQETLTYVETNLARCDYTVVSGGATYFDVTLIISAADLSSNTIRLYMPVTQPALDPSLASNYLPVVRYMCRDLLGPGTNTTINTNKYTQGNASDFVDPALWDYSYPYTLYTTSLGRDYGAVATINASGGTNSAKGYECPPIPNDISNNPIYDYDLYSLAPIDVTNITNPDPPSNSKTLTNEIWPTDSTNPNNPNCPTGAEPGCETYLINRHDFYLATFSSGVFSQPVCIIHRVSNFANGIDCSEIDTSSGSITIYDQDIATQDEIGFAAFPDVNENCPSPSAVTIPAGKKWAKLWQFRTSYDIRYVDNYGNPSDIGTLFCTTRENECASNVPGMAGVGTNSNVIWPLQINSATGGSGTTVNGQAVDTVCWNTRSPAGYGAEVSIGPVHEKQQIPGSQEFGNCNSTLNWGDFNGDEPGGIYSVFGGAIPYQSGQTATSYNGVDNTPQSCTGGSGGSYICCLDSGHDNSSYHLGPQAVPTSASGVYYSLPANYAVGGGDYCTPTLIGGHAAEPGPGTLADIASGPVFDNAVTAPGLAEDVWLIGSGNKSACIEADTTSTGSLYNPLGVYPPPTRNPFASAPLQLDSASQSDILYVVTPANITISQMQNPSTNPPNVAAQFTPWRPKPVEGGNDPNGAQQIYSLTTNATSGASGVNSNIASARLSQFPLCVLQDAVAGAAPGNVAP